MTPLQRFKHQFKDKKVLIMGLGLQGRGVGDAQFLAQMGAKVTVTDVKSRQQLAASLKQLKGERITYVLGKHRKKDFQEAEIVVRNADVPQDSPLLKVAQGSGARVVMDETLFLEYAPVKTIGVTGTRGKTTTATLIYQILKASGKRVFLAGNIRGRATLPLLKQVKTGDWVVLELSSWQLQGFKDLKYSPHIAVVTSIFPDHLNRYRSMKDYIADKKLIFQFQKRADVLVLNREQRTVRALADEAKKSTIIWFQADDIPLSWKVKIPGRHNRQNMAAALQVCRKIGIKTETVKKIAESFPGVPYRLQPIKEIHGVTFINDTTSTTPAALQAALTSFTQPIILIAGGASKNLPIKEVAQQVAERVKAIVLLSGSGTPAFVSELRRFGKDKITGTYSDISQAVAKAFSLAVPGDIVLLSPGFASFGLFANEFDRGDQFNLAVTQLSHGTEKKT